MKAKIIVIVMFSLSIVSCANLEHINSYARNSELSIKKYDEIDFSFQLYCNKYQEAALTKSIQVDIVDVAKQECRFFKNSDSVLNTLHEVLLLYLSGIERLSNKDLIDFNLDKAADNLTALKNSINFEIKDNQIASAKKIVAKLLNEVFGAYRKNKIKKILLHYKDDFNNVMDAYLTGLTALEGEARQALLNYKNFYTQVLLEKSKDTAGLVLVVRDYRAKEAEFQVILKGINNHIQSSKVVQAGYQELLSSANDLTSDSLKAILTKYVNDIKFLRQEVINFKKENT